MSKAHKDSAGVAAVKLLVTGAEGQLARCIIEAGATCGVEVVALGRPKLDITVPARILAALNTVRPDVIVNAAAYTAVDKAESEPHIAHAVNAIGAGNVARAADLAGVPIIHISTDYVFDGRKESAYSEIDDVGPASAYGRSKLEGERLVAEATSRHVIVRTAWVHSPFGHNFVKTMLKLAAQRPQINVVDDQLGSPTYAPHLAVAIIDVARQVNNGAGDSGQTWGTYHACGRGETTWCGLAREVFEISAQAGGPAAQVNPIATSDYPTPASRPANSRLSCDKLKAVFGVALPDWRSGVEECVARLLKEP